MCHYDSITTARTSTPKGQGFSFTQGSGFNALLKMGIEPTTGWRQDGWMDG